jgi:hypothetical protein
VKGGLKHKKRLHCCQLAASFFPGDPTRLSDERRPFSRSRWVSAETPEYPQFLLVVYLFLQIRYQNRPEKRQFLLVCYSFLQICYPDNSEIGILDFR